MYSEEFKQKALEAVSEGRGITQTAKDLDISRAQLNRWVKAAKKEEQQQPEAPIMEEQPKQTKQPQILFAIKTKAGTFSMPMDKQAIDEAVDKHGIAGEVYAVFEGNKEVTFKYITATKSYIDWEGALNAINS